MDIATVRDIGASESACMLRRCRRCERFLTLPIQRSKKGGREQKERPVCPECERIENDTSLETRIMRTILRYVHRYVIQKKASPRTERGAFDPIAYLGCDSWKGVRAHLESQIGSTDAWNDWVTDADRDSKPTSGSWYIGFRVHPTRFDLEDSLQVRLAFHYTNLRPDRFSPLDTEERCIHHPNDVYEYVRTLEDEAFVTTHPEEPEFRAFLDYLKRNSHYSKEEWETVSRKRSECKRRLIKASTAFHPRVRTKTDLAYIGCRTWDAVFDWIETDWSPGMNWSNYASDRSKPDDPDAWCMYPIVPRRMLCTDLPKHCRAFRRLDNWRPVRIREHPYWRQRIQRHVDVYFHEYMERLCDVSDAFPKVGLSELSTFHETDARTLSVPTDATVRSKETSRISWDVSDEEAETEFVDSLDGFDV